MIIDSIMAMFTTGVRTICRNHSIAATIPLNLKAIMLLQMSTRINICPCFCEFVGETRDLEKPIELSNVKLCVRPLAFYSGIYAYAGW